MDVRRAVAIVLREAASTPSVPVRVVVGMLDGV